MSSFILWLPVLLLLVSLIKWTIVDPLYNSQLARIPGPKSWALSKWGAALAEWKGTRTRLIHELHRRYGTKVRIGPNEVHFNSASARRTIYGAGSTFERTRFYRMFDVYGEQNVFTFGPVKDHAERKKLIASTYSKSRVLRGVVAEEIEGKVADFMKLIAEAGGQHVEIYTRLHWYSLDNITNFIYGPSNGGTSALRGNKQHQALIDDIMDPARRELTWFIFRLPTLTNWLYSQNGIVERWLAPLYPMKKPTAYTAIREHAYNSMQKFSRNAEALDSTDTPDESLIANLWKHHSKRAEAGLSDLQIASECSDHFLAGIDTTSDTIMFLIWAISRPENRRFQTKLIEEARNIPAESLNQEGNPTATAADRLPYLNAVLQETLRLYAPIPESEPRVSKDDHVIDGSLIPAGTIVACAPYSLHRDTTIFPDPLKFDPERWFGSVEQVAAMKRWWWAFSSGARKCVGMHLAMAEMALVPAIYRRYTTHIEPGYEDVSPAIISRMEVFNDDLCQDIRNNTCWIRFVKHVDDD